MTYKTKLQEQIFRMFVENGNIIHRPQKGDLLTHDLLEMLAGFRDHTIREHRDASIVFRLIQLVWDAGCEDQYIDSQSLYTLICYFLSMPDVEQPDTLCLSPDGTFIARWREDYRPSVAEFMPDCTIKWGGDGASIQYIDDPLSTAGTEAEGCRMNENG